HGGGAPEGGLLATRRDAAGEQWGDEDERGDQACVPGADRVRGRAGEVGALERADAEERERQPEPGAAERECPDDERDARRRQQGQAEEPGRQGERPRHGGTRPGQWALEARAEEG